MCGRPYSQYVRDTANVISECYISMKSCFMDLSILSDSDIDFHVQQLCIVALLFHPLSLLMLSINQSINQSLLRQTRQQNIKK